MIEKILTEWGVMGGIKILNQGIFPKIINWTFFEAVIRFCNNLCSQTIHDEEIGKLRQKERVEELTTKTCGQTP